MFAMTKAARQSPRRHGYALGLGLALIALVLRALLTPLLDGSVPYLISMLAVTATAVMAGFRPALFATVFSALGVNLVLFDPKFQLTTQVSMPEFLSALLFLLIGVAVSWLGGNRLVMLEEARATGDALREREAQLRALTDNLPGAMTYQAVREANGATRFVYVSASVKSLNGLTPEEVYADPSLLYSRILPESRPALLEAEERAVRDGRPFELVVPMRHASGDLRWMRLASSPRILRDGRQVWDGVQFDVTELYAAQEALRSLNTDLEERVRSRTEQLVRSNQELERFAYVASHDLKAPLRTITSYLQLLARRYEGQLDGKAQTFITFSVEAAERMGALIDDLLAFSRLGRERKATRVEAQRVVHDVLKNLQGVVMEHQAVVHVGDLPAVVADETQIRQVLQNLIANALKFHAPGRPPEVWVEGSVDDDVAGFTVRDNGIGIEPQHQARIFDLFQRLHGREQYAGSGIGLAIVKKIVDEHGGRVWVDSTVGAGTAFHFTLPAALPTPQPTGAASQRNS